ncbi:heterokaryon incompatibility protein-domain-containing protein [Alternaria rosae]|uniref:heterokaryon incompatibility protein-domain-containing protein n=1 Tax=Alternaria rosae TaxID=1187941 RepID=UPI001E8E5BEF|nr:heterokaryon incompatibility protein-domain-containing protein [Alternaria rosae]KAH6858890.1 heterokaryon incompatibility protein-domain-containing protein [Alternaria rosae]
MAANIELDRSLFPVLSHWGEGYLARLELLRPLHDTNWKGRSLVYLMNKFKLKESRIRRDRVYSLLSLCEEGKDLQVDYDATDLDVAKEIIRRCKQSFCLCAVNTITFILQLESLNRSDVTLDSGLQPFGVMTLPVFSQDLHGTLCSARPCLYRSCDGTENSHLPGFVEIVSYNSGVVHHWNLRGSGEDRPVEFIATHYECSWSLMDGGKSCTVMFSFELLVEIARLGRGSSSGLCARVADTSSAYVKPGRLLSKESRVKRTDLSDWAALANTRADLGTTGSCRPKTGYAQVKPQAAFSSSVWCTRLRVGTYAASRSVMADDLQQNSPVVPRPEPALEPFAYAPLDHQRRSIRLIRVLATKSKEGKIRCDIRHASVSDSYICLSYVWGEQDCGHTVLLNSKPFKVRSNLFDFLARARQNNRLLGEWLWVDAMCIDQANVGERNQQVQQMGRIYSYAKEVISWFGEDKDSIAAYFVEQTSPSEIAVNPNLADLRLKFTYAPYWNRAWITQEVQLAQKVTLLAKTVEVDYRLLRSTDRKFLTIEHHDRRSRIPTHWMVPPRRPSWLPSKPSLIYVMSEFGYKRCHDIRDRVYSLLALCDDGSDVQVDYNTSVERLARHTLECCGRSFCLCSMRIVHDVLHLGQQLSYGPLEDASSKPFAYMTLPYHQGVLSSRKCTSKPSAFADLLSTTSPVSRWLQ